MKNRFLTCAIVLIVISSGLFVITTTASSRLQQSNIIESFLLSTNPIQQHIHSLLYRQQPSNEFNFSPQEISLQDDAFHAADSLHFSEWWYFDAILNDGYSLQFIIQVYSMFNQHMVNARLNLYYQGELIVKKDKFYLPTDFTTSTRIPLVLLNDKRVMSAKTVDGHLEYLLEIQMDDVQGTFTFTGTTPGWKGDVAVGHWIVPLPKADVKGTLTIGTEQLVLSGIGYHDHNYEITAETGLYFGWYWGKIHTESTSITWSNIMPTCFLNEPLLVINTDTGSFFNIDQKDITITADDFYFENGCLIPHSFLLDVSNDQVNLKITMDVLDIHHVRVGLIKYWRYHVHATGSLTINEQHESIDEYQITEFIRFR